MNYQFQIQNEQGRSLGDYEINHEKIMHVFVIRKDRTNFQHIHPEYDEKSKTFTLKELTFTEPGSYRIFADFKDATIKDNKNKQVTIYEDLQIGSEKTLSKPVSTRELSKTFGMYDVIMISQPEILSVGFPAKLAFSINDNTKNGEPVRSLSPYLGAYGHAVIFDSDLNLMHTHSISNNNEAGKGIVEFEIAPSNDGNMLVFAQFKDGEKILTTDFGIQVNKSLSEIDMKINSGEHEGH